MSRSQRGLSTATEVPDILIHFPGPSTANLYAGSIEEGFMGYEYSGFDGGIGPSRTRSTRSTPSDLISQAQPFQESLSGQSSHGEECDQHGPFYSVEGSPNNFPGTYNQVIPTFPPVLEVNQVDANVSHDHDLLHMEGASSTLRLDSYDQGFDAIVDRPPSFTVDNDTQPWTSLAYSEPWSQLRHTGQTSNQTYTNLQQTNTQLYYDTVTGFSSVNPFPPRDDTIDPFHGDQSELVVIPSEPLTRDVDPRGHSHSRDGSEGGRQPKGGRLRGSHLSAEGASNARAVRGLRACFRCKMLREQCSQGRSCDNCQRIALNARSRKWKGCYRSFEEFRDLLLPGLLVDRLSQTEVDHFVIDNCHVLKNTVTYINLPLNVGFGENFVMSGLEFTQKSNEVFYSRFVATDDHGRATSSYRISLPVVASWKNKNDTLVLLIRWLRKTATRQTSIDQWLSCCFPGSEEFWIRSLIAKVWIYSMKCWDDDKPAHDLDEILMRTWMMTLLVTSLSNPVVVPEEEKQVVLSQLQFSYPEYQHRDVNTSRPLNKVVKHLFVQLYGKLANEVLSALDEFVNDKIPTIDAERAWGHMFCVSILLVVVIGRVQISLIDNLICAADDGRDDKEGTLRALEKLDEAFTNIALVFAFHSKQQDGGMKAGASRKRRTLLDEGGSVQDEHLRELVSEIQQIRRRYQERVSRYRHSKLESLTESEHTFFATNAQRLLAMFLNIMSHDSNDSGNERIQRGDRPKKGGGGPKKRNDGPQKQGERQRRRRVYQQ